MGTGVTVDAIGVDAFLMCNPGSLEVELKLNVIASFSGAFGVGIGTGANDCFLFGERFLIC